MITPKPTYSAISFNFPGTGVVKIANYETHFTHSKKTDCLIDSCLLKTSDCSADLSTTNLILGAAPLYKVTGEEKVYAGYTENFCYWCKIKSYDDVTEFTF